ncbi:hypothetical protein [Cellulophaga sp. L1A9]|uniref:hypothetical protein n=1 Tax=Cellulophaga sp. L1A9 TaxID=2686362 RepID=UPI00131E5135|nr:hypothetical protein [Cellulophaga sp. L1A9]
MKFIFLLTLILFNISCKESPKTKNSNLKIDVISKKTAPIIDDKLDFNKDTIINSYDELANTQNREKYTVSEYNTDDKEIENIKRPSKSIVRNLEIDTTNAFGIWTLDPDGPHADFLLDKNSFYIVDYDGDGAMPYILDKNEITVFYNDFIQKGIINSSNKDTLKIKWKDYKEETTYVKFPQ